MSRSAVAVWISGLVLLAGCGCEILPGGEPPPGNLADNTPPPATSPRAVYNGLVTRLSVFALQENIRAVAVDEDDLARAVAHDAARVAGFRIMPEAEYRLCARREKDGSVELILRRKDNSVRWQSGGR